VIVLKKLHYIALFPLLFVWTGLANAQNCPTETPLDRLIYLSQDNFRNLNSLVLDTFDEIVKIVWISDNELAAISLGNSQVYLLDSNSNAPASLICGENVRNLAHDSTNNRIILITDDISVVNLTDLQTFSISDIEGIPTALAANSFRNSIAVSTSLMDSEFGFLKDNQIKLLSLSTKEEITPIVLETDLSAATELWFGRDGEVLLISGFNQGLEGLEIQLWNTNTGNRLWNLSSFAQMQGFNRIPFITAATSDGVYMALAIQSRTGIRDESGNMIVQIWDLDSHELVVEFDAGDEIITALDLHPSLPLLLSGTSEGTVKIWDIETQALITSVLGHTSAINQAVYSNTGALFATSDTERELRLWGGNNE